MSYRSSIFNMIYSVVYELTYGANWEDFKCKFAEVEPLF